MKDYRYKLEPYKGRNTRFICPSCKSKNEFTRYIDTTTGNYVANHVGICNKREKCNYHCTPKMYFTDNGIENKSLTIQKKYKPEPPLSLLSKQQINANYSNNYLFKYLCSKFDSQQVEDVFKKYRVGSSNKWQYSTVFYQFDKFSRCRTGKIMQYSQSTGKRIKKPYNRITWMHSKIENYNLKQCLFGEHLVNVNDSTPLAIVESEKTALVMAICQPEFIWLATGGLSNLNSKRVSGLGFRKIVLFPDSGCAKLWSDKIEGKKDVVVTYAFDHYPKGTDLADIILNNNDRVLL